MTEYETTIEIAFKFYEGDPAIERFHKEASALSDDVKWHDERVARYGDDLSDLMVKAAVLWLTAPHIPALFTKVRDMFGNPIKIDITGHDGDVASILVRSVNELPHAEATAIRIIKAKTKAQIAINESVKPKKRQK